MIARDQSIMDPLNTTVFVISAHAADFVWRAGGAIALYSGRGCRVRILCLSYGERGESERLWRQPGMTLDRVKAARKAESEKAAAILGAEIRFFDAGDYPLRVSDELIHEMVAEYRRWQPEQCGFKPQVLLDITPVFERKRKAMESMEAQEHLWEYYTDLARRRGTQAVRNSGRKEIRYAEAYQRVYPQETTDL